MWKLLSNTKNKKAGLKIKLMEAIQANRKYKVVVFNSTDEHSPTITWTGEVINEKGKLVATTTKLTYNEAKASVEQMKKTLLKGGNENE